jgi:predicted RNase H-like nuclease (RuvC/YqgF family)
MVIESRSKGCPVREPFYVLFFFLMSFLKQVRVGAISLVDLAGSERLKSTQAEGQRAKEGVQINKSLLTLGLVIRKLSTLSGNVEHVPYRDSSLTRILQPALGGNSRTAIVCNISPSVQNVEESLSTLKFASQAKMVTNVVSVNEIVDDRALLQRYKMQIEEMAGELERLRSTSNKNDNNIDSINVPSSSERDLQVRLAQQEDELSRLRALIVTSKSMRETRINQLLHRETWCSGLDGASVLSQGGAVTCDLGKIAHENDNNIVINNKSEEKQKKKAKEESQLKKNREGSSALEKRVKELEGELQDAREMQEALEADNRTLDMKV